MSRRPPAPDSGGASTAWMATFSDLLMLMLTFFVLLLTMSSMDDKKVKSLTRDGIQVNPSSNKNSSIKFDEVELSRVSNAIAAMQELAKSPASETIQGEVKMGMEELLKASGIHASAWVEVRPDGVLVNLDGGVAFEPGTATLTPSALRFVKSFSAVVKGGGLNVAVDSWVKGEGDFLEQDKAWELSLKRSETIVNLLLRSGLDGTRARMMGYGFEGGAQEGRLLRQPELVRIHAIIGDAGAELP